MTNAFALVILIPFFCPSLPLSLPPSLCTYFNKWCKLIHSPSLAFSSRRTCEAPVSL